MGVHRLTRAALVATLVFCFASNAAAVLPPFDFVRDACAHHRAKHATTAKLTVTQLGTSVLTWSATVALFDNEPIILKSETRSRSVSAKTNGLQWQLMWFAIGASDPANEVAKRGLSPEMSRLMLNANEPVLKYGGRASIQTDLDSMRIRRIRFVSKKKTVWAAKLDYNGDQLAGVTILKNNATRLRVKIDHPE